LEILRKEGGREQLRWGEMFLVGKVRNLRSFCNIGKK
jgi:hypothetical protein